MIKKEVFREYDIRGVYNDGITDELAYKLGRVFAGISDGKVVVGHDARLSSNALNTNLIKGLIDSGATVTDIGLVTTPMLYYARELLNIPYAIMITASHCDKDQNGFKLCGRNGSIFASEIQDIYDLIIKNEYKIGTGRVERYDITYDYKKLMDEKIKLGQRKLKVVVDCGNGTTCFYNPDIIINFNVDFIPLYCDSNPEFPNHIPDPAVEDNMHDLEKKVKEEHADLGIAFDGDGDRIGIVDEKGNLVKTDMFMLIIWKDIYKTCKNKLATFDVKCSNALIESLHKLGLETEFNKTGHSYLKKAVKEKNLDFAGEFSGHVCFNDDFYGYDDALYAALRLLKILSNTNLNVSDYFKDVPVYYSAKEDYIKVGEENKDKIVNKVLNYAKKNNYNIITVDGVRICYDDGFALVRKSNTSPCITVRFEGKTLDSMELHKNEIMKLINEEINRKD